MHTNEIPPIDPTDNDTGCCPRFHPERWDHQELHFERKPFLRASTSSVFHIPLNMGSVFSRTWNTVKAAQADTGAHLVLSRDLSAWQAEHLFAVGADIPGADMVHLSGDFVTKVFEGPFSNAARWCADLASDVQARGKRLDIPYFFYTTCPRCAKRYGKNYVVGVAKVREPD